MSGQSRIATALCPQPDAEGKPCCRLSIPSHCLTRTFLVCFFDACPRLYPGVWSWTGTHDEIHDRTRQACGASLLQGSGEETLKTACARVHSVGKVRSLERSSAPTLRRPGKCRTRRQMSAIWLTVATGRPSHKEADSGAALISDVRDDRHVRQE